MIVVCQTTYEESVLGVQNLMSEYAELSFSPMREQPDLNGCLEFRATGRVSDEQKQILINTLNNDWDQDGDQYWAYGFNTKMFDPLVYYLSMDFTPIRNQ